MQSNAAYLPSKKCSQNGFPFQAPCQAHAVQTLSNVDVIAAKLISCLSHVCIPISRFLMFILPTIALK